MAEQMRAFPSGDWPGKFSVTHALPQALNRSIVLRNHKHAGTGPAQRHRCRVPAQRSLPGAPRGAIRERRSSSSSSRSTGPGWAESSELSACHSRMPLFSLAPWEANTRRRQPCIRVLPQQTSRGKKKKRPRGAFCCASSTPPRVPSTQFIFLPIKVSPPAWLCETQFMLGAVGVLLLAGTERGSERGGGSGAQQAALCFGGSRPSGDGKSPCRHKVWGCSATAAATGGARGLQPPGQSGGRGCCRPGAPHTSCTSWDCPGAPHGTEDAVTLCQLGTAENLRGPRVEG